MTTNTHLQFPFNTRQNAITDDYEISKTVVGTGVNGSVLKCQHRQTGQQGALKILKHSEKSHREVIIHKKASENCQYIVKILDIYENNCQSVRCILLVMECMEGGELFNRILQRDRNPYTERDAARYIWMAVQAVNHLHSMDIAHRDLKPENLLLTSTADDAILKLADFGFAKEGKNEPYPLSTPMYTPYYVAPEILSATRYDKACDIWSLGVITYILLCGYPPFYSADGPNLSQNMKKKIKAGAYKFPDAEWRNISQEAKSTIQRMLTVNPVERITISEILHCSWLTELTSVRPIDISSLQDEGTRTEIQAAVASATDNLRRNEEDIEIDLHGPETSHIAKRAAKRRAQAIIQNQMDAESNKANNSSEDANH